LSSAARVELATNSAIKEEKTSIKKISRERG